MIKIAKSREVNSSIDRVWDTISNIDSESKHWSVIKNVRVLHRDGNMIEREATIMRGPMGNVESLQTLVLDPKKSIVLKMTKGVLIGTRTMVLNPLDKNRTRIDVTWEFELVEIPGFARSFVKDRISEVTEVALTQIAEEAERPVSSSARRLPSSDPSPESWKLS